MNEVLQVFLSVLTHVNHWKNYKKMTPSPAAVMSPTHVVVRTAVMT